MDGPCQAPVTRSLVREPLPYRGGSRTVSRRGGAGNNNPSSSSREWFHYLLGFPSGKKGWCRESGPKQWVPALSSSLDRAMTGDSDWATGFYGGLIRLCNFEVSAPSCTDPSS